MKVRPIDLRAQIEGMDIDGIHITTESTVSVEDTVHVVNVRVTLTCHATNESATLRPSIPILLIRCSNTNLTFAVGDAVSLLSEQASRMQTSIETIDARNDESLGNLREALDRLVKAILSATDELLETLEANLNPKN